MRRNESYEPIRKQVLADIDSLRHTIAGTNVDAENTWFRGLLVGILNCVLIDYENVEIGVERSVYLAAWGRRNLLETKIVTQYVLASEEQALTFRNELLIDAKQFYESITKEHQRIHAEFLKGLDDMRKSMPEGAMRTELDGVYRREAEQGPKTNESAREAAHYRAFLAELGLERVRPQRASEIASSVGNETKAEFDPMFKICSKIVHRTSFSIASTNVKSSLDEIGPFLKTSAFSDVIKIYVAIKDYVGANGIKPLKRKAGSG
jgi:hypothetical protein